MRGPCAAQDRPRGCLWNCHHTRTPSRSPSRLVALFESARRSFGPSSRSGPQTGSKERAGGGLIDCPRRRAVMSPWGPVPSGKQSVYPLVREVCRPDCGRRLPSTLHALKPRDKGFAGLSLRSGPVRIVSACRTRTQSVDSQLTQ